MFNRVAVLVLLVPLAAACGSSAAPSSAPAAACTIGGQFKVTVTPALSNACPPIAPLTDTPWLIGFDADAGVALAPAPLYAVVTELTTDETACTTHLAWTRPASGACPIPESATTDYAFTASGVTATLDYTGCANPAIGLHAPQGCSARYTITGVRQ